MKRQKVIKITEAYVEIFPEHLHTVLNFSGERSETNIDEDDSVCTWVPDKTYQEYWIKRSAVMSIDLQLTIYRQWAVRISATGMADDLSIYFDKDDWEQARDLADKLTKWMLSK